jgi:hypothetical protein
MDHRARSVPCRKAGTAAKVPTVASTRGLIPASRSWRMMIDVIVSLVGHLGVSVQERCLDSQHVLVVKAAGVDIVVSAAAAV